MFDLEQAITDWRQKLKHAGVKGSAVLDELESHLRDEIEAQLRLGLTEQQAFETAVARIGPVNPLGHALTRDQRLKNAFLIAFMALYSLVAGVPVLCKLGSFSGISSAQQVSALAAVLITSGALFIGRLLGRLLPVVSSLHLRIVLFSSAVMLMFAWLSAFYHHVMTRVEWDLNQLVVAIPWAFVPLILLGGVLIGMEDAAANQTPKAHV